MYTIDELLSLSIKEKLDFLRKYDRNYQIFGSRKHQYLLHEPLSEEQIASFENAFHVQVMQHTAALLQPAFPVGSPEESRGGRHI